MTETPARRTRASTRTSATPAPSTAAGRRARPKTPKPLPAVPTARSHAYGATGKVSLATQLADPSADAGGFAARFGADRGAAVGRDVDETAPSIAGPVRASTTIHTTTTTTARTPTRSGSYPAISRDVPSPGSASHKHKWPAPYMKPYLDDGNSNDEDDDGNDDDIEDHDIEPEDDLRIHREPSAVEGSVTDLETHFSYTTSMPPSSLPRRVETLRPPPTTEERDAARPWRLSVLLETVHRWWQDFNPPWDNMSPQIRQACLALLFGLLLMFVIGPAGRDTIAERSADVWYRAGEYAAIPLSYVPGLPRLSHRGSVINSNDLSERMQALEIEVRGIKHHIQKINPEEIKRLQDILPENLIVQKNKETGQFELPRNFWRALQAELDQRDAGNAWERFVEGNQKKLDQYAKHALDDIIKNRHIVSKEVLTSAITQNHAEISKEFSQQLHALEASVRKSSESAARRIATDIIKAAPGNTGTSQLHSLALANIARNTELALQTVNFFSIAYGAYVDPRHTSPTYDDQQETWRSWMSNKLLGTAGLERSSPRCALEPWREAAECWCAAASERGRAQLGVRMSRAIKPTSVTVEHIPSAGTLDISAAPKEFEVWVRNSRNAEQVPYGFNSHLSCGGVPSDGFVCVGKAEYDIHAPNHVQNFDLEMLDDTIGFVDESIIKVNNNWGQNYTCIYRVRMHGDPEIARIE